MLFFHGENLFIYLSVKSFLYRNFSNFTKELVRNRTILKINTRIQNLLKSIQFFVRIILSIDYHPFVNSNSSLNFAQTTDEKSDKKYHLSKTYHFSIINLKKKKKKKQSETERIFKISSSKIERIEKLNGNRIRPKVGSGAIF